MAIEASDDAPRSIDALCRHAERLTASTPGPLRRLRVRAGDLVVELEWAQPTPVGGTEPTIGGVAAPTVVTTVSSSVVSTEAPPAVDDDTFAVTSPLVGTFYQAPAPGESPFVQVGDIVTAGQQIGIVEAMKLMNPVEADRPGRVVDVLVEDGKPVEYSETLIMLAPV